MRSLKWLPILGVCDAEMLKAIFNTVVNCIMMFPAMDCIHDSGPIRL